MAICACLVLLTCCSSVKMREVEEESLNNFYMPKQSGVRKALAYFRHWSQGKVKSMLSSRLDPPPALLGEEAMSVASVMDILNAQRSKSCPFVLRGDSKNWKMHESQVDEDNVQHTVLQSVDGELQYVAMIGGDLLVADPAACLSKNLAMIQESNGTQDGHDTNAGGESGILEVDSDPMVQDCSKLFHRTAKEKCGKDYNLTVITATVKVIDGFEVRMAAQLLSTNGTVCAL